MIRNARSGVALLVLVLAAACAAHAADDDQTITGASAARKVARPAPESKLEERVRLLSVTLELDAGQQTALRKLLEQQRDEVNRVWNDAAVPAVYRVSATRAVSDKTADRIRALLNEDQRQKYNPPRQLREAENSGRRSVEDWMNAAQQKR